MRSIRETHEFRIDEEAFYLWAEEGRFEAQRGPAVNPDLTMTGDAQTFMAVASGRLALAEAADSGVIRLEGARDVLQRCAQMLGVGLPLSEVRRQCYRGFWTKCDDGADVTADRPGDNL